MKLPKNGNAEAVNFSIYQNHNQLDGDLRSFGVNFTRKSHSNQCKSCGGDYLRHSVKGFCQFCLNKIEFITREYPQIIEKVKTENQKCEVSK